MSQLIDGNKLKQILDAALKVCSQKGYSKTTFVDIADEIGLTNDWGYVRDPDGHVLAFACRSTH